MKTIGFLMFLLIFNDFPFWKAAATNSPGGSLEQMKGGALPRKVFGPAFDPGNFKAAGWECSPKHFLGKWSGLRLLQTIPGELCRRELIGDSASGDTYQRRSRSLKIIWNQWKHKKTNGFHWFLVIFQWFSIVFICFSMVFFLFRCGNK